MCGVFSALYQCQHRVWSGFTSYPGPHVLANCTIPFVCLTSCTRIFFFFHNHFIYICTQVQLNTNFAVYNAVIKRDLNNEPLCWWFWLIRSRDDYYETAMSGRERRFTDKRVTPRRLSLIYLGLSLIRLLAFSYIPLVAWIILEGSADRCIIFGNVFMYYCEFKPSYTF